MGQNQSLGQPTGTRLAHDTKQGNICLMNYVWLLSSEGISDQETFYMELLLLSNISKEDFLNFFSGPLQHSHHCQKIAFVFLLWPDSSILSTASLNVAGHNSLCCTGLCLKIITKFSPEMNDFAGNHHILFSKPFIIFVGLLWTASRFSAFVSSCRVQYWM